MSASLVPNRLKIGYTHYTDDELALWIGFAEIDIGRNIDRDWGCRCLSRCVLKCAILLQRGLPCRLTIWCFRLAIASILDNMMDLTGIGVTSNQCFHHAHMLTFASSTAWRLTSAVFMVDICSSRNQCHCDITPSCEMQRCRTLIIFVIYAGTSLE